MPSVREILLKGSQPKSTSAGQRQEAGENLSGDSVANQDVQGEPKQQLGGADAELIAERLRMAAEQRAALAQNEINRLQLQMNQLQERMVEVTKQNLPTNAIKAQLDEVAHRLEEAREALERAHEAKQNAGVSPGLGREHSEAQVQHHDHGQGHDSAHGNSVRSALGKNAGPTKLGGRAPARRL